MLRIACRRLTNTTGALKMTNDISLDSFAHRQFDDDSYSGTKIRMRKEDFMVKVVNFYAHRKAISEEYKDRPVLVDGYAPFCKHLFMPNFNDTILDGAVTISPQNESLLKTSYQARNDKELPVLVRYFPKGSVQPPVATFLDLICKLNN